MVNFIYKLCKKTEKMIDMQPEDYNLHRLGSLICDTAFELSRRINDELLRPMSRWLDDPSWMERFKVYEDRTPHWAKYKRRQRQWTKQRRTLAAERLQRYWQNVSRRRKFIKSISKNISRSEPRFVLGRVRNKIVVEPIIKLLSPIEESKRETQEEFRHARDRSITDLLPWRAILAVDINETTELRFLKKHLPEKQKKETISKFIHLLNMEADGEVELSQDTPFGKIEIIPAGNKPRGLVKVSDRQGGTHLFDWNTLNHVQRIKILTDVLANRIICRTA
jgi:chromatin segregation and condensation protein Rec8/ScpA/Scc1 (kleisin family)